MVFYHQAFGYKTVIMERADPLPPGSYLEEDDLVDQSFGTALP